jgi:hypothetical protein
MRDIEAGMGAVLLLEPQDITNHTDVASSLLDLQGYEGANIAVLLGTVTNTDGNNKVIPVLQECDTTADADFTAVAVGDMIGGLFTVVDAAADDSVIQLRGYIGTKRYVRVNLDFTSAGANPDHCPISIMGILGKAKSEPVTAPAAVAAT